MAVLAKLAVFAALVLPAQSSVASFSVEGGSNPIRKVVTMLQGMQKKVEAEGQKEKELYDKFMCHCKSGGGDLSASIQAAEAKIPDVGSSIEAAEGKLAQTKGDLKQAQVDRSAAKDAMAEAIALREKEAAAFKAEATEHSTNIAAIRKAVAALDNGMAGSFLQTQEAQLLRNLIVGKADMLDGDRQEIAAFLSTSTGSSYSPRSGEISGILKSMGDDMQAHLDDITAQEHAAIKTHEELVAAKTKEVQSLSQSIETKTQQIGELGVSIVQMKEDLDDTQAALLDDQQYLQDLTKSCSTKTAEWEERSKTRAEELVALADTIKVLNDDDALDLFKHTLASASASFMQVRVNSAAKVSKAGDIIRAAQAKANAQNRPGLDLLMLSLLGHRSQGSFDKVIKMVDNMVAELKKEQVDDDHKKEYCATQLDLADDKRKELERSLSDRETAIANTKEGISTLTSEIAALENGIKALDKSVAEATEQRKAENVEYKQLLASNGAAKELLDFAKNRLNKFYNPKLYKPAPKAELTEEQRINVNMGGEADATPAPGGIAGTGIAVFAQVSAHRRHRDAPAPPPETWGAYSKKSEESAGVVAMVDLLIRDLEKEITESETSEKNAQKDYERMMADSAAKRAADSKSLTQKGSAKADMETDLQGHEDAKQAAGSQLMGTVKYIQSLHAECDWLMQYYDVRKEARAEEVDSLERAKAVLNGADYSLAQIRSSLRGSARA